MSKKRKTAAEIEEMFISEINEVGISEIAYLDAPGGYQAMQFEMADGNLRHWKIKEGRQREFESRVKFVKKE